MKWFAFLLIGLVSLSTTAEIKSTELDLFDKLRDRPVKVRVWYQASQECAEQLCVAAAAGSDSIPVAIISHGAFGSPREMNWLGYGLAAKGWLAVGVAHFGESWVYGRESIDHSSLGKKWLRSQDISFVLDQLLVAKSITKQPIDNSRLAVFGHSLGGYSALSMVGADYNIDAMFEYCKKAIATDRGCRYGKRQSGKAQMQKTQTKLPQVPVTDDRVTAVVSLDPALGPAVSKESLTNIKVPTLIVGSVENDFLNFNAHANYYASSIKDAKLVSLANGEGHFIYIDKCEHPHQAMGVPLCKDREGVNRGEVHTGLMNEIGEFINQL